LQAQQRVGWQPSRFLADRAEAERAFALAERLGCINAAAAQLGTTWPSLRKPPSPRAWRTGPQPRRHPAAGIHAATSATRSYSWQPSTR
jgi:hypothetical protein